MKKICILALMLCSSCGSVVNKTNASSPSMSAPFGDMLVVFNSHFTDPIGNLSTIDLLGDMNATPARITTDGSDAIVRSFGGRIYVVNRYGTDTVQVVDPANFKVIANYSVGSGSNPQDIVVISDDKAFISRLDSQNDVQDSGDVLIINPLTGEKKGSIDLTPYTADDGDRFARATQMAFVDNRIYVCMQDLPLNLMDPADANGKVAVIDTGTDDVIDAVPDTPGTQVIELSGMNPSDIAYSPVTEKFYVSDTGRRVQFIVDTADATGGIEVFQKDGDSYLSEGIVIDDLMFGGDVTEVRLPSGNLGFTIVGSTTVASFNPTTYEIISSNLYKTPGAYLPDIAADSKERLFVAEYNYLNPGVVILNGADGSRIAGPIEVGSLPVSMTFIGE